jgi:hypothetical protein
MQITCRKACINYEKISNIYNFKIATSTTEQRQQSPYSDGLQAGRPEFDSRQKKEIFSPPQDADRSCISEL